MSGASCFARTLQPALAFLFLALAWAPFVPAAPLFRGPEFFDAGNLGTAGTSRGGTPGTAAAGDLNGDGLPDLVVLDQFLAGTTTSSTAAVLLHHSSSAFPALFRSRVLYSTPPQPWNARLVDINKDNKLDLAMVYGAGATAGFAFMLGDGSGGFGPPALHPLNNAIGIGFADLNNDTWLDVIVSPSTGGSLIYLGTGGGVLGSPVFYPTLAPICFDDVTGDGAPDILSLSGSNVTLYPGNLTGAFPTPTGSWPLGFNPPADLLYGMTTGNLNGDAALDLVFTWLHDSGGINEASNLTVLVGIVGGGFQAPVHYPVGVYTRLPQLGDIDGDGKNDVTTLLPQGGTTQIVVKKGNGDGTLGTSSSFAGPWNAVNPVMQDFDQDGRLDITLIMDAGDLNGFPHNICVMRNDGAGGFLQSTMSGTIVGEPGGKVIADFNRDGKPDLVVGDGTAVKVGAGNGDGTFSLGGANALPWLPKSLTPGDTDLNGTADLIVGNGTGQLYRLSGGGDGSLVPSPVPIATGSIAFPRSIADMNRDGIPDLVVTSPTWQLMLLIQSGTGAFGTTTPQAFPLSAVNDLLTGDWNRDGIIDVAVATATGLGVALGTSPGSLALGSFVMSGRPYTSVCAGDFNEDGIPDLAVRESAVNLSIGRGIDVFLGTGSGAFNLVQTIPTLDRNGFTVAAEDVNRDGSLDLITQAILETSGNNPDEEAEIHLGLGNGTFSDSYFAADYLLGTCYPFHGPFAVGDVDRDGSPDIITSRMIDETMVLSTLRSNPPAKFNGLREAVFYPTLNNPGHVAVGDLNRDGKPDVVTGAFGTNPGVAVLLGSGTGTLGASTTLAQSWTVNQVGLADFNRDGILDIAASNTGIGSPRFSTMLGVGDGTFGARNDYYINAGLDFEFGDMNHDGKLDCVTASQDSIQILPGTGLGTFTAGAKAAISPCYDLDLADLNRDGYLDVVCAGGSVKIFYGGAGGTLGAAVNLSAPISFCQTVCVADFNRDGFLDIVANNSTLYYVIWGAAASPFSTYATSNLPFEPFDMKVGEAAANGVPYIYASRAGDRVDVISVSPAGALASVGSYVVSSGADALALGDLDHDGLVDVVSIGSGGSFVAVNLHGFTGAVTGVTAAAPPVTRAHLRQNYPNPFNPRTTIRYALARTERAHLGIFDVQGRLVVTLEDGIRRAGEHTVDWDGRNRNGVSVGSGIYLYRLMTESGETESRRMVVVK